MPRAAPVQSRQIELREIYIIGVAVTLLVAHHVQGTDLNGANYSTLDESGPRPVLTFY